MSGTIDSGSWGLDDVFDDSRSEEDDLVEVVDKEDGLAEEMFEEVDEAEDFVVVLPTLVFLLWVEVPTTDRFDTFDPSLLRLTFLFVCA